MAAVQRSGEVQRKCAAAITPQEFVAKWSAAGDLNEQQGSQHHFLDLCDMLGVPRPYTDERKADYGFQHKLPGLRGEVRYADVWKCGCFAWEYKRPGKSLVDALDQLVRYAYKLDNPPLMVVSDTQKFEIHTRFTGHPTDAIRFTCRDLLDPRIRGRLRDVFLEPYSFKPTRDSRRVTETVAASLATVADLLRDAGVPPADAAHFLCQYVFCCFAEDIGLMKGERPPFKRLLRQGLEPRRLRSQLRSLFQKMRRGGSFGADEIPWFNGGLFDAIRVPELPPQAVRILAEAAEDRWDAIDASIFGTLFQRGLDPARRAQHGAFYTNPAIIERLVTPVVQETLVREWDACKREINRLLSMRDVHAVEADHIADRSRRYRVSAKAKKARKDAQDIFDGFLERLRNFRVLDPACGSGNFLFFALKAIKDVEMQVHADAGELGLQWQFAVTGVQNVLGIEVDPYAAELARMTVWISELQWRKQHHYGWEQDPILRKLEHIECRDAVLEHNALGGCRQTAWPDADVIVGNPPFIGNKKMREDLGDEYTVALRSAYSDELSGGVDFVCYWFHKALIAVKHGRSSVVGLVSTQALRRGSNRTVLDAICADSTIFRAWSDEPWVNEGAAVRVSLICFGQGGEDGVMLDGAPVERISADLTGIGDVDLTTARPLQANLGVAFQGSSKVGPFEIPGSLAREWLLLPNASGQCNADVLRPWANGQTLARRPADEWIIDFGTELTEARASMYEKPHAYVSRHVKPERTRNNREAYRRYWWRHAEARSGLRQASAGLSRLIATPRVAKHRFFIWLHASVLPDTRLYVVARDDDVTFGVLSSRIHEVWALGNASMHGVGNDPTYNAQSCFETFPFPELFADGDVPIREAIEDCARELNRLRNAWLNPPEWTHVVTEVTPVGMRRSPYPARKLAKKGYEARLADRTMTKLYNDRPAWLQNVQRALDHAVARAYRWEDYSPEIPDSEILRRLLQLNAQRSEHLGDAGAARRRT